MNVQIIETKPTDIEVELLLEALSETLEQLTGSTGKNSFQGWDEQDPKSVLVKAISANEAVGCGAIRPITSEIAELKRMYSRYKGKGIGKSILIYLERKAKELGYKEIWLETRKVNTEACAFYLKNNYQQIPNYGKYAGNETAICFGKTIMT